MTFLQSPRDIAALSQQCRSLHRLCDMPLRRKYRRVKLQSERDLKVAFDMLLSILRAPYLGSYVRHLRVLGIAVVRLLVRPSV